MTKQTRREFLKILGVMAGSASALSITPGCESIGQITVTGKTIKPSELDFDSATEAARAIRNRQVSSVELTEHILKRIDQYNPSINAIVTLLRDEALGRARAADKALAKGKYWGPLHGVPITIKDAFEIAGVRTTVGAPSLADYVPKEDAVAVSRLRAAGAVILGHTNVPFMLDDWQSYNKIFGTTNNPWDMKRTPGGSTGGGSAALAAGLSYLSMGSDIGGSIRVPAHFCGVYGHKPTLNLIPDRGHIPPPPEFQPWPPHDLAVSGPLARSASDLKMALEILGGPDTPQAIAYSWSLPAARANRLSDYHIGYVVDDALCPLSSDVKEVIVEAIAALRKAGAKLERGWPSGVDPADQFNTYRFLLYSTFASYLQDDQKDEMRKRAAKQDGSDEAIKALAWTARHNHFQVGSHARMVARATWQTYFRTHDVFLMPTAFVPAFPHDHSEPMEQRKLSTPEGKRPYNDLLFWISFATLAGLPATTAPVGLTRDGLPVGIQIIGPYLEDATPIDVAGKITDVIGGFKPPKGY